MSYCWHDPMKLLAELKRRNVIRMAGLYLVGAWLLVQVAATLLPVFGATGWVMKLLVVMVVLVIGLVATLGVLVGFRADTRGFQSQAMRSDPRFKKVQQRAGWSSTP